MKIQKHQLGASMINPKVVTKGIATVSDLASDLSEKWYNSKIGKLLTADPDAHLLSDEDYVNKHGYAKPLTGIGPMGLLKSPQTITAAGKIIDLNKIKNANVTLSDPEKYFTLFHQTDPGMVQKILSKGFSVKAGDLLGTTTIEGADLTSSSSRLGQFLRGQLGHNPTMNHRGYGAGVVIRIPKSEVPAATRASQLEGALIDRFSNPNYTIPKEWLTGFIKDQLKQGGAIPSAQSGFKFEDWYKTIPKEKNDTTTYNLRRAFELAPKEQLDAFVKDPNAHLYSVYLNNATGEYEFMKRKDHPTIQYELDWYNSNDPDAVEFRKNYKLDMNGDYYKYIPIGKSGIHIKPENKGKFTALKKRTGKSSTWYKEHGTPEQKKMAIFALNAKHWKH